MDMFVDMEAPTITVEIGQHVVTGVQLDGGAAVSLMTDQTMQDLGLGTHKYSFVSSRPKTSQTFGYITRCENRSDRVGVPC